MWVCPEMGHTVLPYSKSDVEARAIWHVHLAEPGKMGELTWQVIVIILGYYGACSRVSSLPPSLASLLQLP